MEALGATVRRGWRGEVSVAAMRSSVQAGDDGGEGGAALASYWWRPLVEHGGSEGEAARRRVRVLREMERLAAAANESLDDLRHKLLTYKAGDLWFPAGGVPKQEMDIPPVVSVLLIGLAGAGKSTLVDLMYYVLGRAGFVPFTSPAGKKPSAEASIFGRVED